jgi:hypothetical protein
MSASHASVVLDQPQRAALAAFADVLIAGGDGLPSASEAKLHEKWIDRVLRVRPDLGAPVLAVLGCEGDPAVELERVRAEDPVTFAAFAEAVAGGYLLNPRVCKLLGLPGNAPKRNPAYPDEADFYLEDGILDAVRARGPIYRPTPEIAA